MKMKVCPQCGSGSHHQERAAYGAGTGDRECNKCGNVFHPSEGLEVEASTVEEASKAGAALVQARNS